MSRNINAKAKALYSLLLRFLSHDISESISMSDRIIVLTNRPAKVKQIHTIDFEMKNRTPINCRKSPKFSEYFDTLWKELDVHA